MVPSGRAQHDPGCSRTAIIWWEERVNQELKNCQYRHRASSELSQCWDRTQSLVHVGMVSLLSAMQLVELCDQTDWPGTLSPRMSRSHLATADLIHTWVADTLKRRHICLPERKCSFFLLKIRKNATYIPYLSLCSEGGNISHQVRAHRGRGAGSRIWVVKHWPCKHEDVRPVLRTLS